MKIKKKAKRISSVALCVLMLLTALPMTAVTVNAAAQAYIKYIDTEVYIGDVLNIIVGVNSNTDETFTYQWQAKYPSLSWVNLSDKTDRPDSKFSGVFTDHLKFQTYAELVGPGSGWKDVVFRCKVTGSKSGTFYSGKCNFPGLLEKTEIPTIGFLGLEKPEQRKIPSTTATPINSTYYSFDYIEWYEYKNNKVGRKLNDGEAFDSGMYCCQLYFNMNKGYAVAKNAVCGLYNDDGQATILQDETTGQYYIWAYYVVADKSPSFSHQYTEAEIMKGKEKTISVTANNAASYQWQIKVRRSTGKSVWRNIDDNSSTSNKFSFKGTKTNALTIRPNTDFDETHFRCAVTGENGDVIYSVSVKVTQEVKARVTMNLKTGGSPDDTITVKVDRYTFDGVYKGGFEHETVNSNAKPLYVVFDTSPGKYVITVSKPQCIARVYEIYLYKDDISFDVNITVPYDVNMDGVVNVIDATLVQKQVVHNVEFDSYQLKLADTDNDGTISVVDATNIQKKIVGLL
ncbi:dockerin type I repeat-containing protein [Ruminococcus bromii]|uniref:dockerin type I repeat-containing protein n=1 Tax=Ruminococcus bromii TaxID=40518 RepID=UPI003AB833A3